MRSVCTGSDAREVIEIMKASMVDYYENEDGLLDLTRCQNGSGSSKGSQIKQFVAILEKISQQKGSSIFSFDELKSLIEVNYIFSLENFKFKNVF